MKNLKNLIIAFLISANFITSAQDDGDLKFVCKSFLFETSPFKNFNQSNI
jgi:hypothetical protein